MIQTVTPANATRKRARVTIRPIEAVDASGLSAFYAALSDESRGRRFLAASRGISAADAERFASVDHLTEHGYLAVVAEAGPNDGLIVGHATLTPSGSGEPPEMAFAVADAWQRQGIGSALMREVICTAERLGMRRLSAALFADNIAMRRLLAGAGWSWRIADVDGSTIEVELESATAGQRSS
jgi:RimJ/RimL family protein N-acetyltransferase